MLTFYIISGIITLICTIIYCIFSKSTIYNKIPATFYTLVSAGYLFLCESLVNELKTSFGATTNYINIFMVILTLIIVLAPLLSVIETFVKNEKFNRISYMAYSFLSFAICLAMGINLYVSNHKFLFLMSFLIATLFIAETLKCNYSVYVGTKSSNILYFIINSIFCLACIIALVSLVYVSSSTGVVNAALILISIILIILGFTGIVCGILSLNKLKKD